MIQIKGFCFTEKIYERKKVVVYRGVRESDNINVIAKVLKSKYPTVKDLKAIENEYKIIKNLNIKGVIKVFSLKDVKHSKAIIIEDFGGIALDRYMSVYSIDLKTFLKIGIEITRIINEIHKQGVIHKDIKPQNIIINPKSNEVKIVDFSIATQIIKETQIVVNPEKLEGTLAYISPEQTGRMNRSIDFRSDLYSLGVTFYEMLTGRLPFKNTIPIELVHAHIADKPIAPHIIKYDIPSVISDIVMKLLSKTADMRFQTAFGLQEDLKRCLNLLEINGRIERFNIGKHDASDLFHVSEKIYGRENELRSLNEEFIKVINGEKRIVMFTGPPGIGKSFLINEIQKPLLEKRGFFITGKFDQFKRDIPYSSIIQAFKDLIRQLLTENDKNIDIWKNEILDSVGKNGQLIIDVIPDVELIIGKQQPVLKVSTKESENRFRYVFQNFIKILAKRDHPLVLFLDDLQWADKASLELLIIILKEVELKYFLLIGAYRDNDENIDDSLMQLFEKLKEDNLPLKSITLKPLGIEDLKQLIMDTFLKNTNESIEMARLIKNKTGGNPFFIKEFLINLYNENYIIFNNGWQWDIEQILSAKITDNAVELMARRISKLSKKIQNILKIASCTGVIFYPEIISQLCNISVEDIFNELKDTIKEGIIIKKEEQLAFAHDRLRKVVYNLLTIDERVRTHYDIGMIFLSKTSEDRLEESIFTIVLNLNIVKDALNLKEEKTKLAQLNYIAGKKAKNSTAFDAAKQFFLLGIELLPRDAWENEYNLTYSLYSECGEVLYHTGDIEQAEDYLNEVILKAKTLFERIKIYEIKIINYTALHKIVESLQVGIEALKIMGIRMPKKANKFFIIKELFLVLIHLRRRRVNELINLPKLNDPDKLVIARLLMYCTAPCYLGIPEYFPIIVLKLVNISLKYGNSAYSSYAYVVYGIILCDTFGNIEKGYSFGILALKILEKFNARELSAKINFIYGVTINHWKNHISDDIEYLLKAYKIGLETGDLAFASYGLNYYMFHSLFQGIPLSKMRYNYHQYYASMEKMQRLSSFQLYRLGYQLVVDLSSDPETEDDRLLSKQLFDEEEIIPQWVSTNDINLVGIFSIKKLIIFYFQEDFENAVKIAMHGKKYLNNIASLIFVPEYYFYYSLSLLAHYPFVDKKKQKNYLKIVKKNSKKMKKWSISSPKNYEHKYILIEAEIYRLKNRFEETIKLYNEAIALAHKNGFTQDEAIANELAAKYCSSKKMERISVEYLREAYYLYGLWGVKIKSKLLDEKYPGLINQFKGYSKETVGSQSYFNVVTSPSSIFLQIIDFNSFVKACHDISQEVILDKLMKKVLHIMIENAGAEKGVLLLKREENLYVEVLGMVKQEIKSFKSLPFEQCDIIPKSIIRFVNRTKETVILDDALKEKLFSDDKYIQEVKPKSTMCIPVIKQDNLIAILYLENNLSKDVFTQRRHGILKLLTAQAAISFENALLYNSLTQEITEKKHTQKLLQYRVKFEKLIIDISTRFINLPLNKIDSSINEALKTIGKYSGVDRCNIYQFLNDKKSLNLIYEWNLYGTEPIMDEYREIIIDNYPWIQDYLNNINDTNDINVTQIDDLLYEINNINKIFQINDIKSIISIAIYQNSSVIGFLTLSTIHEEKEFSDDIVILLKVIGEVFNNLLFRKKFEENLNMYKDIVSSFNEQMLFIDSYGKIQAINESFITAFNNKRDEIIGHSLKEIFGEKFYNDDLYDNYIKCLNGEQIHFEHWFNYPIAGQRHIDVSMYPHKEKNYISGMIINIRDTTDKVQIEKELVEVKEQERQQIGIELHDGLAQELLGIAIQAKLLCQELTNKSLPEASKASDIENSINESMSKTRTIAKGLFPIFNDDITIDILIQSIKNKAHNPPYTECSIEVDPNVKIEDDSILRNLYYIIQEAVSNSIKHSKAKNIIIKLFLFNDFINLKVIDDGIGFSVETETEKDKGLGLKIMKYRSRMIRASFSIKQIEDGGTEVSCTFK